MPFDREGTLRKAEKLLRQGKLDLAIAEYRTVVDEQPTDWNTSNILGDLYVRARQVDKAVTEYTRIADHLANQGFLPKAAALYKKILRIKPEDERTLWELGMIAESQGLMVEARSNFLAVVQRRRARGDRRGEAEVRARLGDLAGADLDARLAGARSRVELGEMTAAVDRLKQAAAELQDKGKTADALVLLTEAVRIAPDDRDVRLALLQTHSARGDFGAAAGFASSAADLEALADELFGQGRAADGADVLRKAVEAHPSDIAVRARLVKLLAEQGDADGARALLTPEIAAADPDLAWMLAEKDLRAGRVDDGIAAIHRVLGEDPSRRNALVTLGCAIADTNPDAAYQCIEIAADSAIAADEWESAAAAVNEFVNRVANHIPALMRLVEICVDGRLEATMSSAQAQLADAYLASGAGEEARVIAEDLVAREPWERANVERFRRALALLGEPDVDAIIAERLSGQSPFTSTDFMWPAEPAGTELAPTPVVPLEPPAEVRKPAPASESSRAPAAADLHGIDVDAILAPASDATVESVLKGMRDQALSDASPETADQHFKLAGTYAQMGMKDDALKALEVAARSPRHRFRAGAMLAKAHLEAGDRARAIEWYERAVEATAPSADAQHALLYDLALALESHGESVRALAVLLELRAEAGEYRDISTRLEHLKVQIGS